MSRARSAQPATATSEDSADETTRIFGKRRNRGPNYQATQASASLTAPPPDGQADEERSSWWKENWSSLWSIELENKGSVARDHLAIGLCPRPRAVCSRELGLLTISAERTFLAWLRTSLAFASIGIAVTQLFRLNTSLTDGADDPALQTIRNLGQPLGSTFLGISILVLLLGYLRFFQSQKYVISGKFPAARLTIVLVSLIACALMVICLVVVVVVHPQKPASRAEL